MSILIWSYLALWILVISLIIAFAALARQIALLYGRLPQVGARVGSAGPAIGSTITDVTHENLNGKQVSFRDIPGSGVLMVFVSPECSLCEQILPAVKHLTKQEKRFQVFTISGSGDLQENRKYASKNGLDLERYVLSSDFYKTMDIGSTPYAVLTNIFGKVLAKGLANNREHLDSLLNTADFGDAFEAHLSGSVLVASGGDHQ